MPAVEATSPAPSRGQVSDVATLGVLCCLASEDHVNKQNLVVELEGLGEKPTSLSTKKNRNERQNFFGSIQ